MHNLRLLTVLLIMSVFNPSIHADPSLPLPGKGLDEHPFLYAGEWDHRHAEQTLFIVRDGKVDWTYQLPIKSGRDTIQEFSDATMLSNGNTVISYWCPGALKDPKDWKGTIQVIEVTPQKDIVWALSAWEDPADLGPATCIQLLDEPGIPENMEQQR